MDDMIELCYGLISRTQWLISNFRTRPFKDFIDSLDQIEGYVHYAEKRFDRILEKNLDGE